MCLYFALNFMYPVHLCSFEITECVNIIDSNVYLTVNITILCLYLVWIPFDSEFEFLLTL